MFGAPLWLLGVFAWAAPIIIHLLNRQRFKRVTWAAMEWLLKALERNRRRMRVENLLLLILRVIIVVLVALALSRPILEGGAAAALGGSRVCRIFVVDNSYSMGVRNAAGQTPLDRAKRAVADMLASSQGGDTASLVVTGAESSEVVPEPTADRAHVQQETDALALSSGEANLPAVLARVAAAADKLSSPRIRLYVFTDMQRTTWMSEGALREPALVEAFRKIQDKVGAFLVDCSGQEWPNTAVEKIVVSADESGEEQGLVAVDQPVTVLATLEHFAREARGETGVRLLVDGRLERQRTVTVEAHKPVVASFPGVVFPQSGAHVVTVEADCDALVVDDRREAAVDVEREVKVLCVNGSPSTDLASNETYFLERALAPQQFEFATGLSVFSVETVNDIDFVTRNLNDYRLVVLANVFQVPPEKIAQLEAFVRRGGGLVVFLGDRTESAAWNDTMYAAGNGLLPARILERKSYALGGPDCQRFDPRSTHEIVRTLADRSVDLGIARVYEYYYLEAHEDSPGVHVLFRFDNPEGSPAAVEKVFGLGRVILIGTSATARWSTFPLSPTFAPFLQELAGYAVRGSTGRRNLLVGEPIRTMLFPGEFGTTVTVTTPRGDKLEHQPAPEGGAFRFEYPDTSAVGVYSVDFGGTRGKVDYCVALDTRESDLARLAMSDIDRMLPDNKIRFVSDPEELRVASGRLESGAQLWKTLIYAALVLMIAELLLARVFGSRRGIVRK